MTANPVGNYTDGYAFSAGEHVGVLVNMDSRTMDLFRDGTPISDSRVEGFPKDVRIAALTSKGTIRLAFPAPPTRAIGSTTQQPATQPATTAPVDGVGAVPSDIGAGA